MMVTHTIALVAGIVLGILGTFYALNHMPETVRKLAAKVEAKVRAKLD